jgi:putative ABC transport system permease protein
VAVPLVTEQGDLLLQGFDLGGDLAGAHELVAGDPAVVWPAWRRGEGVLISEPLAYRRRLAVGDELSLPTERGERAFPVLGIVSDYGPNPGAVVMARSELDRHWRVRGATAAGFYLAPGVDTGQAEAAIRRAAGNQAPALELRSTAEIKQLSLAVFDRTFRITGVLRTLAGVVAFLGVLSALMALALERSRELALLRALGLTPRGLAGLVTLESGLMGLAAGALSLPVGTLMAAVMVRVINRRSFGWSLELAISPPVLLSALALALAAALAASLYPAWSMSRTKPAAALRAE